MSLIPLERVARLSKRDIEEDFHKNRDKLSEKKDFTKEGGSIFFSRSGLLKLGYILQDESIVDILDTLESRESMENIYLKLENRVSELADEVSKSGDLDKIEKFLNVFSKFIEIKDLAYKFAVKTGDNSYKFASNMGDNAYNFAMKTEDDAFNFASSMGKDAYNFASKGMDYGYKFASKGMQYGYEFASKGEEVGEMANRVLWMASEIGLMADRIGEMSDRIVHTEHIILQTAMVIQNFGLLIDGTMKHLSETVLKSLHLLLDKEFEPLKTADKHLEIISEITKEIIEKNHEYDLETLKQQVELRKVTISALDKIGRE